MINAISDINELNKILRNELITQTELPAKRVRNALTTFGATLDKMLTSQQSGAIYQCDELVLFELRTRENDADVSMSESDNSITYYKSYTLYVIVYGSNSANVMANLIPRLRSEVVRLRLRDEGVFIESVSGDTSVNEYKNDVLWHRHDCSIELSCRLSIKPVSGDTILEQADPTNIIEKEN